MLAALRRKNWRRDPLGRAANSSSFFDLFAARDPDPTEFPGTPVVSSYKTRFGL